MEWGHVRRTSATVLWRSGRAFSSSTRKCVSARCSAGSPGTTESALSTKESRAICAPYSRISSNLRAVRKNLMGRGQYRGRRVRLPSAPPVT
eukprot:755074-Rhodomonas_salina.1